MEYDVAWKPRVLIVEDDPEQRQLYQSMISSMGHTVRIEERGAAAIETAVIWKPDVVLLDLVLPDMSGIRVLEEINADPTNWDISVVAMTAEADPDLAVEVMSSGAVDFLRKPFQPMELILKLDVLLKYKRARHEAEEMQKRLERENALLSRYFSTDLVDKILSGSISTEIGGQTTFATILVLDLRRSTHLSETLAAADFAQLLSDLFAEFADTIYTHGGTIINFTGDGFVVGFGVPKSTGADAENAARTAIAIRSKLGRFNAERPPEAGEPIALGMGIASGELFAGNVGSVHRLDYTVLGDPVNLAARLESLTKRARSENGHVDTFIDGRTRELLGARAKVQRVRIQKIRGKDEAVDVFSLQQLV